MNRPRTWHDARAVTRRAACVHVLALAAGCLDGYGGPPVEPRPPAKTGTLRVTVSTTGADLDPNGYVLTVDDQLERARPTANATVSIGRLRVGRHLVVLRDVAPNCVIQGDSSRTATIEAEDQVVDLAFNGTCAALGGVRVTLATTGTDPDPNGYRVILEPVSARLGGLRAADASSATTFTGLAAGDYRLRLGGVAANCGGAGVAPREVAVPSGDTAAVTFEVACAPVTRLAYVAKTPDGNADIYAVNSNGTGATRLTTHPAVDEDPAWSPDGARIAFTSSRDGARAVYVMSADGSNPVRLTDPAAASYRPAWSPDGRRIAFVSERDGDAELYLMSADGTNQARLTDSIGRDIDPAWSPDGRRIAFASGRGGPTQVHVINADGTGLTRLTRSGTEDRQPAWSPDGSGIAFSRAVCPRGSRVCYPVVFVTNLFGTDTEVGTGEDPAWSPDGSKIAVTGISCEWAYYYDYPTGCHVSGIGILSAPGNGGAAAPARVWDYELTEGDHLNPSWRW